MILWAVCMCLVAVASQGAHGAHCQQRQRAERGGVITNDNCPIYVVVTVVGDFMKGAENKPGVGK